MIARSETVRVNWKPIFNKIGSEQDLGFFLHMKLFATEDLVTAFQICRGQDLDVLSYDDLIVSPPACLTR
jgi:hypothetical protein